MPSENTSRVSPSIETGNGSAKGPLAIIGIGCRFPGADGPEEFWRLLRNGVDAIGEVPRERFDVESVYDPKPGSPGKLNNRSGGFLGNIDSFDASFFGMSPREALRVDPQQRLLLEVTWEALEDGGVNPRLLSGRRAGVFIGACTSDYEDIQYHRRDRSEIDFYVATGTARSILSGRISYVFNLLGPSLTVDTACSSSLVAVHLACQSLWNGETDFAIAGGVNLVLLPEIAMPFSSASMLAPDGKCKFGDARANGFVRSEGVGVVLLKTLSSAVADQDEIYAVIMGTAVNNDGRSSGLLATPSAEGQQAVLAEAYRNAGISPSEVHYVEVHGTGTSVGDPVEVSSLGSVLAEGRDPDHPCILGSVKTNIGHTEGASGIAGLIKTALCLKHREIPPSLHFNTPNPDIQWKDLGLKVASELIPWPVQSVPAVAGVSAFGLSATNVHVVMREAAAADMRGTKSHGGAGMSLLAISAHSQTALDEMAERYERFTFVTDSSIREVCYSANVKKVHHDFRLSVVADSLDDLGDQLRAYLGNEIRPTLAHGCKSPTEDPKVVFVFPGQGSQWMGMGRNLIRQEPIFRSALADCEEAFARYCDQWSLIEQLASDDLTSRFEDIDVIQPCLFAIQVALARLWQHRGIEPNAVIGQSMGEVAAAHIAGALSLDDAARVICRRSILLRRVSGRGGMAVVGLSFEETQRALAAYQDQLSIAVSSSDTSTVIAGNSEALRDLREALLARSVFYEPVKVDVASHSPQMDVLREDLLEELSGLEPRLPAIPVYSTVTGDSSHDLIFDSEYWASNLRKPVLFSKAVRNLLEGGHNIFLEISPHPLLLSSIQNAMQKTGKQGRVLPSMRRHEDECTVMLTSLGALYTAGCSVEWGRLYPEGGRFTRLPSYPWQRERFWLGPERNDSFGLFQTPGHLLSVTGCELATEPGTHFWEFELSTEMFPFLKDHKVRETIVLPAAAYLEMAIAAAHSIFTDGAPILNDVAFRAAFALSEKKEKVQLIISTRLPGPARFEFFRLDPAAPSSWTLHATGEIRVGVAGSAPLHRASEPADAEQDTVLSKDEHYDLLARWGLLYGPCFQGVEAIRVRGLRASARIVLPELLADSASSYNIHPALLDSCFQVLAAAVPFASTDTYLPVGLERLQIYGRPGKSVMVYATLRDCSQDEDEVLKGDLLVCSEDGETILQAEGLSMRLFARQERELRDLQSLRELLYEIEWRSSAASLFAGHPQETPGLYVVFTDRGGAGAKLVHVLEAAGQDCIQVSTGESYAELESGRYQINPSLPDNYTRLLSEIYGSSRGNCRDMVHLWSLDAAETSTLSHELLEDAHTMGWSSALLLLKGLTESCAADPPGLWLVTRGAQPVAEGEPLSVAQSPLWGLGRVIANEHPELRCSLVDLGAASDEEIGALGLELWSGSREDQIAFRGEERYVARLVPRTHPETAGTKTVELAGDGPFCLEVATPGILDSLTARRTARRKPGPSEIEIEVESVGLNFRDVMLAMGVLPSSPDVREDFGWECSGRIVDRGEEVGEFEIGEEVFAIAHPCFGAFATTHSSLALHKPAYLSFAEAAAVPLALLTAYYSLKHLGRLQRGERVLIHAASGGVGLAALQIARHQGAEVFATAGNEQKRAFLGSLGIRHVFDSRSLDFADGIMQATNGEGVDIVLNSLAGEAIQASLSLLKSGGRFMELGRRDIYNNARLDLGRFRNNISFFAIDLGSLIRQNPAYMGSLLHDAKDCFVECGGSPPPLTEFSISETADAFRSMANAQHIGKIALRVRGEKIAIKSASEEEFVFHPGSTYLITGGLGGLGLSIAEWMISRGAQHLVLAGRSEGSRSAQDAVEAMRQSAEVVVSRADVSRPEEVMRLLHQIRQSMPTVKGVVHAAGLLDDGVLLKQDRSRFDRVMAPKIAGAWNMHSLTLGDQLDFFVLFSSAATILGSAGQGNYSAANAFLDCLAHYRRSQGLPGTSINWGPWADVGLAAQADRGKRLEQRGVDSIAPERAVKLFGYMLSAQITQVAAMDLDLGRWTEHSPAAARAPLFAEMTAAGNTTGPTPHRDEARLTRNSLLAAAPSERTLLVHSYLNDLLARVLGLSRLTPETLDAGQPLNRFGLDSLMALEMKMRIEADLGIAIPIVSFLKGASISHLAAKLLDHMPISTHISSLRIEKRAMAAGAEQWEELSI